VICFLHELHQLTRIKKFHQQSIRVIITLIKFVLIRDPSDSELAKQIRVYKKELILSITLSTEIVRIASS
jgi:hypothetical protein